MDRWLRVAEAKRAVLTCLYFFFKCFLAMKACLKIKAGTTAQGRVALHVLGPQMGPQPRKEESKRIKAWMVAYTYNPALASWGQEEEDAKAHYTPPLWGACLTIKTSKRSSG